jgi:LysM repeat protein
VNRGFKVLTTVLIIVIGILAVSSGFLYAKTTLLQKQLAGGVDTNKESESIVAKTPIKTDILSPEKDTETSPSANNIPIGTTSVAPVTTASPKITPSIALKSGTAGTYTVASGDTMYSIALKLKINWLDLAEANGLDETTANKIKVGQVLVLPK